MRHIPFVIALIAAAAALALGAVALNVARSNDTTSAGRTSDLRAEVGALRSRLASVERQRRIDAATIAGYRSCLPQLEDQVTALDLYLSIGGAYRSATLSRDCLKVLVYSND